MSREKKKSPHSQGHKKRREGHKDSPPPEARDEAAAPDSAEAVDKGGRKNAAGSAAAEQKIAELEEQVRDLTERLQRKTAEFANYQKRIRKEMDDTRKYAVGPLALELLSVLDSFDRAIGSVGTEPAGEGGDHPPASPNAGDLLHGLEMIHSQLKAALAAHGIVPIEALNEPFDPNYAARSRGPASTRNEPSAPQAGQGPEGERSSEGSAVQYTSESAQKQLATSHTEPSAEESESASDERQGSSAPTPLRPPRQTERTDTQSCPSNT